MDSGTLRIILLVLGVVFLATLFLWERVKIKRRQKRERNELLDDAVSVGVSTDEVLSKQLDELETLVREQETVVIKANSEELILGAEATVPDPPEQILSLAVISKRKYFSGDAIISAMRGIGLDSGPMDIFYRFTDERDTPLYGVANMLEPGNFPLADMSRFTTSGLMLFAQLPGIRPGSEILEDMIDTAEQLAAFLDGTVNDDQRQPLTEEHLESMRETAEQYASRIS